MEAATWTREARRASWRARSVQRLHRDADDAHLYPRAGVSPVRERSGSPAGDRSGGAGDSARPRSPGQLHGAGPHRGGGRHRPVLGPDATGARGAGRP